MCVVKPQGWGCSVLSIHTHAHMYPRTVPTHTMTCLHTTHCAMGCYYSVLSSQDITGAGSSCVCCLNRPGYGPVWLCGGLGGGVG